MKTSALYLSSWLRQAVQITVFLMFLVLLLPVRSEYVFDEEDATYPAYVRESPDKRPARLSYFRSPYSSSRGSMRYRMPWENLPDTNCLRAYCSNDSDCCRRFSKCNRQAHVCYDCWYGHPCQSNRDCCERFPYCHPVLNTCGK